MLLFFIAKIAFIIYNYDLREYHILYILIIFFAITQIGVIMAKRFFSTVVIALVLAVVIGVFVGCESYSNESFEMDNATVSESNGGYVVAHGDYLYFINGYSDYLDGTKENWFGNVLKGAVLRIGKNETDMSKAEVIVPKSVIADKSTCQGISIYGEYVYYVSSGVAEDRTGAVITSTLQFLRTRLDGQDTSVILEIEDGLSTSYKYTPNGLVYLLDGTVYFKSTEGKIKTSDKGSVIVEDVANVYFPQSVKADSAEGVRVADYFFYTKANEDSSVYTNELYVASPDGSVNKNLINATTYTDDPIKNSDKSYSVSIVSMKDEGDALTVVYTKSYYLGTSSSSTVDGTYMYKFDKQFNFDPEAEIKLSTTSLSSLTIISYEEGVVSTSSTMTLYSYDFENKKANAPILFSNDDSKITSATVIGIYNGYIYYYTSSSCATRIAIDRSSNIEILSSSEVCSSFMAPELVVVDDNAYIFYLSEDGSDYLYRVNVSAYNPRGDEEVEDILFGIKTEADIKAEEEDDDK